MRSRLIAAAALVLALTIVVVPASAAPKPTAVKGHSRPNCRALLPLAAIATATGRTLEFSEVGPDRFLLGKGKQLARAQGCTYSDPTRAEFTVFPYGGYFKAAFEATPQDWNAIRAIENKAEPTFKNMKTVDGAKLFAVGNAVPVLPPSPAETGETSFIFGYTRQHNVFEVGITNVPIATETSLVAGIAEGLDAEWLHGGKSG